VVGVGVAGACLTIDDGQPVVGFPGAVPGGVHLGIVVDEEQGGRLGGQVT